MTAKKATGGQSDGGATTGYETELWAMADALRGSMDAVEYRHVVLGLIFLKYISDAFEERRAAVLAEWGEEAAEDRDEYIAGNIGVAVALTSGLTSPSGAASEAPIRHTASTSSARPRAAPRPRRARSMNRAPRARANPGPVAASKARQFAIAARYASGSRSP